MSIILSFDVSSNSTGWASIEKETKKLLGFGLIRPKKLENQEKLFYFANRIQGIIDEFEPNDIVIEEVVMCSSVSTMRVLARFQGVAIYKAFAYLNKEVELIEPTKWKKKIGLLGNAEKCDIQLNACKRFNLLTTDKIKQIEDELFEIRDNNRILSSTLRIESKMLKKKMHNCSIQDKEDINNEINKINSKLKGKIPRQEIKKKFAKISEKIESMTNINTDIADAIGIAMSQL
ncbi:MAG: crossover junction endodeoxyribonuclease RuvC [Acidithiobacillus sp.]|jgi:Holliday junction resolvasome RuvABC endonuclease subunit|uniref:crossover junction endodeoxyribonuclease RuvC n=1 Tax=Acidithiobacillus sp. TaxID=1872118 RepID=UPI0035600F73